MRILVPILLLTIIGCQPQTNETESINHATVPATTNRYSAEDSTIIAAVDDMLFAAGNYNIKDLEAMVSDKAMLGITARRDGVWSTTEIAIGDYFESIREGGRSPYTEIPNDYDIIVTEGQLASVRADCITHRLGIAQAREVNHMTLMKENDKWKFLNISWTIYALPEDQQQFDLDIFARSYAQAWCSQRPDFVAAYFAEDGALQVNDGDPATGRDAIADVAQSFMTQFPDMVVSLDSLAHQEDGIEFHWTLTGTDADPAGKGHPIKVSGFERWTMSADNLILDSKGSFDAEEYNRQLQIGQ